MTNTANTEIDWKQASRGFDTVADLYDAYRPGYPEELLEALVSMTGIQADGKILEIGSGTGKATLMFARRGFSILCVEPGQNLVAIAARNLRNYPRVEFEAVAFEDWKERQAEFDLVMSAQAFHWVLKEIGYAKAARALKAPRLRPVLGRDAARLSAHGWAVLPLSGIMRQSYHLRRDPLQ